MKVKETDFNSDTWSRVKQVFGASLYELAPQQERMLTNWLGRKHDELQGSPIPLAEIEGYKDLLTEHLWHPELTRQLNKSKDSTPTNSETSGSDSAQPLPEQLAVNELKETGK